MEVIHAHPPCPLILTQSLLPSALSQSCNNSAEANRLKSAIDSRFLKAVLQLFSTVNMVKM